MAEAEATAINRSLAYQIKQEMELQHISKTALAKMMRTNRSSVDKYPYICFSVCHRHIPLIFMGFILRNICSGT